MEKGKSAVVEGSNINPMEMVGSRGDHDQKDDGDVNGTVCNGETLLRLLPMALCISSLVVMLKNSETNDFGTLAYSNLGAFRYLVHANGICAGYSLLSAVVAAMPRRPITMPRAWAFFLLDQVLTYVILAAATVSTEVLYLGYKGDVATTWSAACVSFGGFCHKAVAAVVITFLALACYIVLSLISSYKLFSRFGAPVSHPSKNVENPIFQG